MAEVPVAVTYDGPTGGAHSLGRMTRRTAYEGVLSFLDTCTEPMSPTRYSFRVHDVPGLDHDGDVERELARRFGRGRIVVLDEDEVADALDFLDDVHPEPTNQWGMAPVWFGASARFRLLDPQTGSPLPGQTDDLSYRVGYKNELRLTMDNRARLGVELCIPEAGDELLGRVLPWLQQHLPCRLSSKRWRAWTVTKSRTLRGRVLDVTGLV